MNEQASKAGVWFSRMERTTRVMGLVGLALVVIAWPAARL